MCYYIGIEDLVSNALIELIEQSEKRTVSFKDLSKYGNAVVKILNNSDERAILILSRDRTDSFLRNCTEYFSIGEDSATRDMTIALKAQYSPEDLRRLFRVAMSFEMILAFTDKEALSELGVCG
ncbi:MAG: hypothetical protein RR547_02095 [Raoultibacter sp.]